MSGKYAIRTRRVSVEDTIGRLETLVARMERRYECSSATMDDDVRAGRARETAEVGAWLGNYHLLKDLRARAAHGRVAGSPIPNTR